MPWMVVMFGVLVVPLGIVSIGLVILQPVAVGAWCALCLLTAVAMLIMISPALDEVVAMGQFLAGARREGMPFWRTFWVGGTLDSYGDADAGLLLRPHRRSLAAQILGAMELRGVPWNLVLSARLGVWLMAMPAALGVTGSAADNNQLTGALVVTWAVIAFGEIARPARLLNIAMGLWITSAPWVLSGYSSESQWHNLFVGIALMMVSVRRGRIEERFGSWNRYLL
jgi:hypothetical protein